MNLQGTPGRTKIVPIDPNNQRVDLDTANNFAGGTFNQVTVNSAGFVTDGKFIKPTPSGGGGSSQNTSGIQGQIGNYGGTAPVWIPDAGNIGVAIDISNNRIWWYFSSTWN